MDTNVIIEAFRTRCWNAITTHFSIQTVATCCEEALTGDPLRPGYVTVDAAQLNKGLRERHGVSTGQRAALIARLADPDTLDAGERDLLAHAVGRSDDWLASCADRAAVNTALEIGLEERFVSLGALARAAGARPALKYHFTDPWLSEVRTTYKLDRGLR
ncbi:MAG: hypothetical protein ACREQ7_04790 [Candidatus Binatia bacterium]